MNPAQLLAHFDRISEAPDAVPRLRRFILDLAVRGKLVDQNPKDESAFELLKRLQNEKARLVKEGFIRSPRDIDVNQEQGELFPLPAQWVWCHLSDVGAVIGGGTPPSGDPDNFTAGGSGIAWLTPADLGKHSELYVSHGSRDLTQKGLRSSSATLIPKGSVLFTSRAPIGYTAIAANEVSTNQGFKSVVPFIPECNLYIAVYFRAFGKWIDDKASGTTFREVSGKIVASLPFPLPPLAEQHRIVAKVNGLMALCDRLEVVQAERENRRNRLVAASLQRLNQPAGEASAFHEHARFHLCHLPRLTTRAEHIQQLRQTILNLAVRGRLVPQSVNDEPASELLKRIRAEQDELIKARVLKRDSDDLQLSEEDLPYDLPPNWQWTALRNIITFGPQNGISPKPSSRPDAPRAITLTATTSGTFNPHHFKQVEAAITPDSEFWLRSGDLLFQRGNTREYVGIAAYYTGEPRLFLYPDLMMKVRLSQKVSLRYIHLCAIAPPARAYFSTHASGAQATMPKINQGTLLQLPVPLPPLAEQHRIVAKVDELLALCDRVEKQLTIVQTESRHLLEAILHEALNPALAKKNISKSGPAALEPVRLHKSAVTRRPNRHFLRAVLSAEIVYQLHVEPTFGRIKHQKILHLCEHIAQIDGVSGEYRREAAGPLDNKMIYSVETELKKQRWYEEYRREQFGHAYRSLEKAGGHRKYLERYWSDKLPIIQRLLEMMRTWDTDRCEIFSTTYAAWNDLLIWKRMS